MTQILPTDVIDPEIPDLIPREQIFPHPGTDEPEKLLQWHQDHLWKRAKVQRNKVKDGGITVYGKRWDSDVYSRTAILGEALYILGGRRKDIETWRTSEDDEQDLSNEEFLGFSTCIKHFSTAVMQHSWILEYQVKNLSTIEACKTFDVTQANLWPKTEYTSIPTNWDVRRIPILQPLLTRIDYLETQIEKLLIVSDLVTVNNTTLTLTPNSKLRKKNYYVYIRVTNTVIPKKDLSLHGVKIKISLLIDPVDSDSYVDPTTAYRCTWSRVSDGYILTPNGELLEEEDKLDMTLKFVNTPSVTATIIGYV